MSEEQLLHNSVFNRREITSDYLKEHTKIGGWLSFFLFAICSGGLLSLILSVSSFDKDIAIISLGDVIVGILCCALAFYTLYCFIERKSDAVFLGKFYIIMVFVTNALSLILSMLSYSTLPDNIIFPFLRSFIWSMVWFLYLCFSERVECVIPPEYRQRSKSDNIIVATMICLPLLFYSIGFASLFDDVRKIQEEDILQAIRTEPFAEGEFSDGRVVFKAPTDYTCQENKDDETGIIYYYMEDYSGSSITLVSDIDNDHRKVHFEEYCKNWEDQQAKELPSDVLVYEQRRFGKYPYWYKLTSVASQ